MNLPKRNKERLSLQLQLGATNSGLITRLKEIFTTQKLLKTKTQPFKNADEEKQSRSQKIN